MPSLDSKQGQLVALGAAGVGTVALSRLVLRWLRPRGPGQDVPSAPGAWPLLGHILAILKCGKDNVKLATGRFALNCQAEAGLDIMRLKIPHMSADLIMVADPDMAEEVMRGDPQKFTKDFKNSAGHVHLLFEVFGETGLFFSATDDPRWGIAHRILKAPFSIKGLKGMFPAMRDQANRLVEALKREVGYGGVTHIDKWVTKMAFETIAMCALGTPFGSFDDDREHPFITALNGVMVAMRSFAFVPAAAHVLMRKTLAKLRADAKLLRGTCSEVVQGRRSHRTASVREQADIMDMMLTEKDPQTGQGMSEAMIVDNVLTFLFAGQDSTAAAMATCLCFLACHPEAKARLLREIDEVVGAGELEWEHLSKLTYLDWCIKETLRLVPPANGIMRNANGDQLLGGKWRIPDRSGVLISIMALHYDKRIWGEDAAVFRPERWEAGPAHKFAYMPFASGPRACTGREFTVVEQKITIVKLLQHFDLRRPAEVKPAEGYHTVKREDLMPPLSFDMDVEFKATSAFTGVYSAFELLKRSG